jgi:hypothetical protein
VAPLARIENLRRLAIGSPSVTGRGFVHVKELSNLRLLPFWNSTLTDAAYDPLREMKSLQELLLGVTKVSREALEKLN